MELIITFFIWLALGISIILALFFISLNKIEFIIKFNFSSTSNLFQQFSNYIIFLFTNPNRRFCE
ncbi:hypothetical protein SAMN05444484_101743 [Flavobacterium chilense]|uniref:Uncharacterized protein n=1 Tax=Flavobacterium chilense TaxID=946677 RepID=A0A1M6YU82_9FLAO|nr:hypothetical protein SAMN05444484_101743 [Flavobacterium chilense]